jgi:hypothetical protein
VTDRSIKAESHAPFFNLNPGGSPPSPNLLSQKYVAHDPHVDDMKPLDATRVFTGCVDATRVFTACGKRATLCVVSDSEKKVDADPSERSTSVTIQNVFMLPQACTQVNKQGQLPLTATIEGNHSNAHVVDRAEKSCVCVLTEATL